MTETLVPGLYVVATPIGNLSDLSERASAVLREAAVVAAEDTRTSGFLVKRAGGTGKVVSLTEHNVTQRAPGLLERARDAVVALVSDAGTPVIADPGGRLIEAAHAAGVRVLPIPGPSAVAAAISASGFEGSDFHFLGFLPRTRGEIAKRLTASASAAEVLVFFESPGRLAKSLAAVAEVLGDPEVVVCRELTKLHEEVVRGRANDLAGRFEETRGECTVVVRVEPTAEGADEAEVKAYMAEMQRAGARRSPAAAEAARRFGVRREAAYNAWPADA